MSKTESAPLVPSGASVPKPFPDQTPSPMWSHMLTAAAKDLNPWLTGHDGELISKLSAFHPGAARTSSCELIVGEDGWISADSLFLLAETAESHGAQLIEFSGTDLNVRLSGIWPEQRESPFRGLRRLGLRSSSELGAPGRCSFWGQCLGRRGYLAEAVAELAMELSSEMTDNFKIEIAGCPLDCRQSIARSDLALVLDSSASWFVVWLGGRHQPFTEPLLPKPWLRNDIECIRELLDLVFGIHDRWRKMAADQETLPELVARVGLDLFEMFMAQLPVAESEPESAEAEPPLLTWVEGRS